MTMSLAHPIQEHPPRWEKKNPMYLHPQEADLHIHGFSYQPEMCRKNCGYYGNPAWHGYCSKCWIQERQKRQSCPLTDGFRHHTGTILMRTDKENACQEELNDSSVGVISLSTDTKYAQYYQCSSTQVSTKKVPDAGFLGSWSCLKSLAKGDFSEFLKALRGSDAQQFYSVCTEFIYRLQDAENLSPNKKAEQMQDFYRKISEHFPDYMTEERDHLLDNIEKFVMTRLYKSVFCLDNSQDEQKDLSLQRRIKSLYWVTPKMLQVPFEMDNQNVKDLILSAVTAILEMDSRRAPQDKLSCISRASDCLFKCIEASKQDPATADDFLSSLIYITLNANPPRLISNLEYITRFCNPVRLITGEGGYCFTNLCCTVSFIETLDASSLSLTQEQFDYLMQQKRPELMSSLASQQATLQQIQCNKKLLEALIHRQDRLMEKAVSLERELVAWPLSVQVEVQEIIRRIPLETLRTSSQNKKP